MYVSLGLERHWRLLPDLPVNPKKSKSMKTISIPPAKQISRLVRIPAAGVYLLADLQVPMESHTLVILAYQFGGSRNHPRCRKAAQIMRNDGFATLLCDLLTDDEEAQDEVMGNYHNDVTLLAKRLVAVTTWARMHDDTKHLRIAYYGVCSGGSAAIIAASKLEKDVDAVVSRDGRPDLSSGSTSAVKCPTLLIAGERDEQGVARSRQAMEHLTCRKELQVVAGASRLFGEPGKHEEVMLRTVNWLHRQLGE